MQQTSGGTNFVPTRYINVITTTSATTPYLSQLTTTTLPRTPITTPVIRTAIASTRHSTPSTTPTTTLSPNSTPSTPATSHISNTDYTQRGEDYLTWQKAPASRTTKRNREDENTTQTLTKRSNARNDTHTANRYAVLRNEEIHSNPEQHTIQNSEQTSNVTPKPKPPPIFIQNVVDYPLMITSLETVLNKSEFSCKTLSKSTVKVNTHTIDAYRKLIRLLQTSKIAYHTYQVRQERSYRVVIKNLHPTIPANDIKIALEEKGFEIRNVTNLRSWKTKEPLPIFFVDQAPNENNKKIYDIQHLLSTKITIEPPRKKKEIPQCLRCQEYGHTRTYCNNPYYCVKCAANHPTGKCTKSKDSTAKCALCDGPHPANYKGCAVYRELQKTRAKTIYQKKPQYTNQNNENTRIHTENEDQSYAQITKGKGNPTYNSTTQDNNDISLTQFLNKFQTMFNQLMNQNSMIINLLSTLIKNKSANG